MDMDLYSPFFNSAKTILKQMGRLEVTSNKPFYQESNEILSKGVSSIITCAGKLKGRILLDMEEDTAFDIIKSITGKSFQSVKEAGFLSAVSELNNIVAGDGITYLNNNYSLGLRLLPPAVMVGEELLICLDNVHSESIKCITKFGELRINVAFEGGE